MSFWIWLLQAHPFCCKWQDLAIFMAVYHSIGHICCQIFISMRIMSNEVVLHIGFVLNVACKANKKGDHEMVHMLIASQ